jgi:hypothetical protein
LHLAVILFWLSVAVNVVFAASDPHWLMLPAALAGWYLADLASGAIHMYMDYRPCRPGNGLGDLYFYEGDRTSEEYRARFAAAMARIGPIERLVFDFKNHHPRPLALGRRSLGRQINSTILFGTLPYSLALNAACLLLPMAGWLVPGWLVTGLIVLLIGGTFAQYFHGTLHREDNPWFVRAMRRAGLLMTPQAHELHHATLRRDFSTNSGWSNPLLNRVFHALRRRGRLPDHGLEPTS